MENAKENNTLSESEIKAAERQKAKEDKEKARLEAKAAREEKKKQREQEKIEKEKAKEEKKIKKQALNEKIKEAYEASAKKREESKIHQNGVYVPGDGTVSRAIWRALDAIRDEIGEPPAREIVLLQSHKNGWNPGNAIAVYALWKKFHGLKGRLKGGL